MLLVGILVFIAVTLGLAGAYLWVAPTRAEQRLQAIAAPPEAVHWTETAVKVAKPIARLSTPEGDWEHSPLRLRFMHAGIRTPDARLFYFAAKSALPLLLALLAFFGLRGATSSHALLLLLDVLLAALAGCYLPNIALGLKVRSRQREIFENFPDAADLLLVCIEAGLGLDAAFVRVGDEIRRKSGALADELHLTTLEMRAGSTRHKALQNLALRTGVEEIATFAAMLTQADKFGTSIGESMRVFSDDLRHKRQVRAEESAAKVPTKMLFPMVVCIFPAVIMVIMGPAAIQIIRTVLPLLQRGV